ncbi:MAG: hypothetical protein VCB43_14545, partial [Myxococcota bacterium]
DALPILMMRAIWLVLGVVACGGSPEKNEPPEAGESMTLEFTDPPPGHRISTQSRWWSVVDGGGIGA